MSDEMKSAPVGADLDKVAAHLAEHGGDFDALILLVQKAALTQQPGAVAPTTAECPHDWGQDEAHEDWARCYKCGISRRKPLAQQPAADDVDAEQFRKGWQAGFAEGRRDQQPTSVKAVEEALQRWLNWCDEHGEQPEAASGARIALTAAIAAQQGGHR